MANVNNALKKMLKIDIMILNIENKYRNMKRDEITIQNEKNIDFFISEIGEENIQEKKIRDEKHTKLL